MKNFKLIILMILGFFAFNLGVTANSKEIVTFNKCVDGDTAIFSLNEEKITVRFLGIDTPETKHPNKKLETFGQEASDYTCTKITNAKIIELEYDPGSSKLDKYGRHLAWIWLENELLQKELIALGYAKIAYIYGDYIYTDELSVLENIAKASKNGLWADYLPKTYIITFDEGDIKNDIMVEENQKVTSYIPEKQGYNFVSWQLNDQDFNFDTLINRDLILVATYEKNYSTIDIILILLVGFILFITNQKNFKKKLKKIF